MTVKNSTYGNNFEKHLGEGGSRAWKHCGMNGGAWCCAEVTTEFYEVDAKNLFYGGKVVVYCPTAYKWCQANLAQIPLFLALEGDTIFFDWNHNGIPDHIGSVRKRCNTAQIYTIEGNTGSPARVRHKTRPVKYVLGVFRPKFTPTGIEKKRLDETSDEFGYQSIYMLRLALGLKGTGYLDKNTVKALQTKAGASPDGAWARKTSIKVQKMIGVSTDGEFGSKSVKALKKWINDIVYPKEVNPIPDGPADGIPSKHYEGTFPSVTIKIPTNRAAKLVSKAKEMSWVRGTPESKYSFKKGNPLPQCKVIMNKRGYKTRVAMSDCGYFQNSIIYAALGTKVKVLGAVAKAFIKVKGFEIVHTGKIGSFKLKPGDIIRYKKKHGQHVVMYGGDGVIIEAGRKTRFGRRIKSDKWNDPNVKQKSIQVLRVIEGTTTKNYLSKGDEGTEVKRLQKFLNWAGYNCGTVDGEFGIKTETAVRNFQYTNGLTVNGIVDSKTLAKMKEFEK